MIRLVCGYKRTGKDTLAKMFNGEVEFSWVVYKNPRKGKHFVVEEVGRIGFADKLREEVNTILNISNSIDYDTFKETVIKDGKTYRDCLTDHSDYRREQNPKYWVERAADWSSLKDKIMITDWRYPNELSYLQSYPEIEIITMRVFNTKIPVPSGNIISEHQLDSFVTDFLLVPIENHEEEFNQACDLFPYYADYIQTDIYIRDYSV